MSRADAERLARELNTENIDLMRKLAQDRRNAACSAVAVDHKRGAEGGKS